MGTFLQSRRARRAGCLRLAVVEGLEGRRLLSAAIFGGRWTGTYQLDAQSTANPADPHYTGSGTIVVDLTNGIGTVSLSGLNGATVVRTEGSTTQTLQVTVTSASGTAIVGDPGTGVTGTFMAAGQIDDDIVTQQVNGPPLHSHTSNAEPMAFPFTGTFSGGVISGNFESTVFQAGHFSLSGGTVITAGGGVGGTSGGGAGGGVKAPKVLAGNVYKKAVALAEASPGLDYGGTTAAEKAAVLIQKHEGTVLFVYPDRHGNPTVGVGFNLNLALNPDAKQTIDDLFGDGSYDAMMASYQRTMDQWKLEHHDSLVGFEYGSAQWKKFFKVHGGTTDKSLNMASGSDTGDILTNVLTRPNAGTGDEGTSAELFGSVLPGYIANARSLVGASVWDTQLDPSIQAALVDLVYNRGYTNTKNEFGALIAALQSGDEAAAARALMNGQLSTGKGKGKVWALLDPIRAIDDFRYIVFGVENKVK